MLVNASAATSAVKLLNGVLGVQEGNSVLRCFHIALARVSTALSNRLLPCACISGLHLGRNVYTSGRAVIDVTQVAAGDHLPITDMRHRFTKPSAPILLDRVHSQTASTSGQMDTCSGTCTSVHRQCSHGRSCTCFAAPINIWFWHQGLCGPRRATVSPFNWRGRRNLPMQRRSGPFHPNSTDGNALSLHDPTMPRWSKATVDNGRHPPPCNESYVSLACDDSIDGIVHEPLANWLRALLPRTAVIPPFLQSPETVCGFMGCWANPKSKGWRLRHMVRVGTEMAGDLESLSFKS